MSKSSRYFSLRDEQDLTNSSNGCYVCAQMRTRKPNWKQIGISKTCLLCANPFCDSHKSKLEDGVCEIDYKTYCSSQKHKDRHALVQIFTSLEARWQTLGREVNE